MVACDDEDVNREKQERERERERENIMAVQAKITRLLEGSTPSARRRRREKLLYSIARKRPNLLLPRGALLLSPWV